MKTWFTAGLCLALQTGTACGLAVDWFGVPTPEERARARDAAEAPLFRLDPLPLHNGDDPYRDIRGEDIHHAMRDIVEFSEMSRRAGDPLWGRLVGSKYQKMAGEYVAARFREIGLAEVQTSRIGLPPQWRPVRWSVRLAAGAKSYELRSAVPAQPSAPALPGGIEKEAVYVGAGRPGDLLGRDVRGKIAILRSAPEPGALSHTGWGIPAKLAALGASGVVTILDIPGNARSMGYGFAAQPIGAGKPIVPGIPSFTIGDDDGAFLEEVLAAAPPSTKPRVRIELDIRVEDGLTSGNVYGLLRGSGREYIVVMAHLDAFFAGAIDNASGVATMLALAGHFSAKGHGTRRRNILFVATAGHHSGIAYGNPGTPSSPGTGELAGNRELLSKAVLFLNCEHTASDARVRWAGRLVPVNTENPRVLSVTNGSPVLLKFAREAIDRYGLVASAEVERTYRGDINRLRGLAPAINFIDFGVWYADLDVPEAVSPRALERTARAFADLLDKTDSASREELERGVKGR